MGEGSKQFLLLLLFFHVVEDVHDGGLGDADDDPVAQRTFHAAVQVLDGVAEVSCLYEDELVRAFLHARGLVEGDIRHFGLEPAVGCRILTLEEIGQACALDVGDGEFAADVGRHLFDEAALGFGEAEGIDHVGFSNFLQKSCFHCLVETDFAFKPFVIHFLLILCCLLF